MSKQDTLYDEEFKRMLVDFYHNGKTQTSMVKECGVPQIALTRWIKQYSTVDSDVLTSKQIKELPKWKWRENHIPI